MLRRLFTLASAVSLLLCAATCVLWVRSESPGRNTEPDELSFLGPGGHARYTLRSAGGRVTVLAPPPPQSPNAAAAASAVARIDNRQLRWVIHRSGDDRYDWANPRCEHDSAVDRLSDGHGRQHPRLRRRAPRFAAADQIPPLLLALEDPARFAAAHHLLDRVAGASTPPPDPVWRQREMRPAGGGAFAYEYLGLRVDLRVGIPVDGAGEGTTYVGTAEFRPCTAAVDPGQLPAVRDRWHRRLDVAVASVPYLWPALGAAALPAGSLARAAMTRVRRRRRAAAGRCPGCGYDLRAAPGRCPECGAVPAVRV